MTQTLGQYLEEMRARHPRLSRREMSREAGLPLNYIGQLTRGETKPKPDRLWAICQRWGTEIDYIRLMELAGHPMPSIPGSNLDEEIEQLIRHYDQLSPRGRRQLLIIARALMEDQLTENPHHGNPGIAPAPSTC